MALSQPAAGDGAGVQHPHFPLPFALAPNVAFWKQVYTEHSVGDFVLHDRDNLGVVYSVVRVAEAKNQIRAAELAKAEVERVRARYRGLLLRLAEGASPDELGPEGLALAAGWGCPCSPETLRRASDNIRVQQGLREKVDEGLRRAEGLLPKIVTILRRHDVPVELAALPLVESTFNPRAYSKAGAAGLWQFIRSTGKQYALVSRKRDDRRDPLRATEAAARLLRNNYEALGSWPLAIVAYNHGHAGIRTASTIVGSNAIEDIIARYDGPRFGFASKNFYAEFLAALDVVHPYLGGHGKPFQAKGRHRDAQQASLPSGRIAIPSLAWPRPSTAAPPGGMERPTEKLLPVPSPREDAAVAAQPAGDVSPGDVEPSADVSASADTAIMEQATSSEEATIDSTLSPSSTPTPLDVPEPLAPEDDHGLPEETALSEIHPADAPETASP
jgi:hypothetical protein